MLTKLNFRTSRTAPKADAAPFQRHASKLAGKALVDAMALERIAFTGRFGVELEMEGITLGHLRELVAGYLGPEAREVKGGILDAAGRLWEVKPDLLNIVELATPPLCGAEDLRLLQGLAAVLAQAGASATEDTGVHVHVDASELSNAQIVRLLGLVAQHETDLVSALKMHPGRQFYCGDARRSALAPMLTNMPEGRTDLMRAYRGSRPVKCLGLNVEHLAPGHFGTLELRYFNGTLDPCTIGCHVGLALAFARFASKDGPMPTAASLAAQGHLPTLLQSLDLQPEDPPSIFLYRNMLGLALPQMVAPLTAASPPTILEIKPFVDMTVPEGIARSILITLPKAARSHLAHAARLYLATTRQTGLHGREMLALSRLGFMACQTLLETHGAALEQLESGTQRAEGLAWLAKNANDLPPLQAAFGALPLAYMIAAPKEKTRRLLDRLRAADVPLRSDAISLETFQRLAYMDDARIDFHLRIWQHEALHGCNDANARCLVLDYVVACLTGVSEPDAQRVLKLLRRVGLPFEATTLAAQAFRGLAALPNAEAYLKLWLEYAPTWCASSREKQRLMEDLMAKPYYLLQQQIPLVDGLFDARPGYSSIRDMMKQINEVPISRLQAVGEALRHVAPHLKVRHHLLALPRSLASIDPAKLRSFVAAPISLRDVSKDDELYVVQCMAQGKAPYAT